MLLSPIEILLAGRSRDITLDNQQDTLTINWSGVLDSKLSTKTQVWALSKIIAVEIQRRKTRHWEFLNYVLF